MVNMLELPVQVICGSILPLLSVFELKTLDTACTNKYLRPQLQQVWKSYQYDSMDEISYDDLCWLCGVGAGIIAVKVEPDIKSDASEVVELLTHSKTLRQLDCDRCVSGATLHQIAVSFPCLEFVTLCGGYSNKALSVLSENCRQLHTVYIRNDKITDAGIAALSQNCQQLHTLRICSDGFTDAGILMLAQNCRQLHTLHINNEGGVTDAGIQALCDYCPRLKHIELVGCEAITDNALAAIANTYPHLQVFELSMSNNITDGGLLSLADKCHELRSVSVWSDNITSRGLTALWATNPNVMDVNISHNKFISDDDVIQLAQCCPLLTKLNIRCCKRTTDASLIALGQHCHELRSINISYLENISDVGIEALAAGCPLLQELNAACSDIPDSGVIALARGCRDMRKIVLKAFRAISNAAISAIAENCPLLSVLDLFYDIIDDASLHVIAQHCHNLIVLSVWCRCCGVSAATAKLLITSCRMLRKLGCSVGRYDKFAEHLVTWRQRRVMIKFLY